MSRLFPNDVIIFWDDAFAFDTTRLEALCNMLMEIPCEWSCGMRVDRVSKEILQLMHDAGCVKINFGVESGSQQILNEAKKGITLDQIRSAVRWAYAAEIYNSCSIIIGHPGDTHETVRQTLDFARELLSIGATSCTFNAMVPFPGTYVYENISDLPLRLLTERWEDFYFLNPTFETTGLHDNDLRQYLIEGLLMWADYKRNRDHIHGRLQKRDAILLGDLLGRNVQT